MKIDVSWYSSTVLHFKLSADWTWDEWHFALHEAVALRRAASVPVVGFLMDYSASRTYPQQSLAHARASMRIIFPPDFVVVAGGGAFMQFMTSTFRDVFKAYAASIESAETLDDALRVIRQRLNTPLPL